MQYTRLKQKKVNTYSNKESEKNKNQLLGNVTLIVKEYSINRSAQPPARFNLKSNEKEQVEKGISEAITRDYLELEKRKMIKEGKSGTKKGKAGGIFVF